MTQNVWEQEAVKDLMQLEEGEFNLCDFALFLSVMKNETAHRNVLSIIMGEKDLELKEVHVEEVVLNRSGQRAIRLDARATDISGRNFATEMQNDTEQDDMRRRARFYQGLMDTPVLKSGRETRYKSSANDYYLHHPEGYFWKRPGKVHIHRAMRRDKRSASERRDNKDIPKYVQ